MTAHGADPAGVAAGPAGPGAHGDEADDHGNLPGHDDHGHDGEPLGPVDVAAWGLAAFGVLLGLAVAAAMASSTGAFG